jgi:hypothetical protein
MEQWKCGPAWLHGPGDQTEKAKSCGLRPGRRANERTGGFDHKSGGGRFD